MMNGKVIFSLLRVAGVAATLVFSFPAARTQTGSFPAGMDIPDRLLPTENGATTRALPVLGPALESVVDAREYFVGPSDLLGINVWVTPPLAYTLPVTPEGSIILPTVGEILVADKTLAEVKQTVTGEIRKKYRRGEITVTLLRPRSVVVMVTGHVATPGLYTMTSVDRVNRAVEEANRPTRAMELSGKVFPADESSTRNLVLRRRDGTMVRVDVDRFLATRYDRWNPFLREGDVITVPRKSTSRSVIGVYGEVNGPGRYEYVDGDSLRTLLDLAQGLTRRARADSILLFRLVPDGSSMNATALDLRPEADTARTGMRLEPGDRVLIPAVQDLRQDYRATVLGEVVHPGTYPITKNSTRLTDLIRHAGGFTESASLSGSSVLRRRTPFVHGRSDSLFSFRGRSAEDDPDYFENEAKIQWGQEFVRADFYRLFTLGDSTHNIVLRTEDTVRVPPRTGTVYVFGQVRAPGHIPFVAGEDMQYYVERAGGFADLALDGNVRLIKASSRQWLSEGEVPIEDGDQIWVPKDVERPFTYYLGVAGQTASILSVALSVVIISIQLAK